MRTLINQSSERIREICSTLRPGILDDFGLAAAMEWHADQFQKRTGIVCTIDVAVDDNQIDRDIATAVFRIFQEALTNVMRHAKAACVHGRLQQENSAILLEVEDNGIGITPSDIHAPHSFGIIGMRERVHALGGMFSIEKAPQQGTSVHVRIPVKM